MKPLVIGTRGSPLAMWQAQWVEEQLAAAGVPSRIKVIKTTGDKLSQTALAKLTATKGAKGVFTKEIDDALLKSRVDVAVHSLKDVPTELNRRMVLGAIPSGVTPAMRSSGRSSRSCRKARGSAQGPCDAPASYTGCGPT